MKGLKWNRYHISIFLIQTELVSKSFTLCLRSRKWEYLSLITTQSFQNLSTDIAGMIKAKRSKNSRQTISNIRNGNISIEKHKDQITRVLKITGFIVF